MTIGNKINPQQRSEQQLVHTDEVKEAELSDLSRALHYSLGNRVVEHPYYLDIVESSPFANTNSELRAAGLCILTAYQIRVIRKSTESAELWDNLVMVQLPDNFVILERHGYLSSPKRRAQYWSPLSHVQIPPEVEEEHFASILKLARETFLATARYRIFR